jgi:hypothetical protein
MRRQTPTQRLVERLTQANPGDDDVLAAIGLLSPKACELYKADNAAVVHRTSQWYNNRMLAALDAHLDWLGREHSSLPSYSIRSAWCASFAADMRACIVQALARNLSALVNDHGLIGVVVDGVVYERDHLQCEQTCTNTAETLLTCYSYDYCFYGGLSTAGATDSGLLTSPAHLALEHLISVVYANKGHLLDFATRAVEAVVPCHARLIIQSLLTWRAVGARLYAHYLKRQAILASPSYMREAILFDLEGAEGDDVPQE